MSNDLFFYGNKGVNGFLSNFYLHEQKVGDAYYPTNEHFFQSQKFAGKDEEIYIMNLPTPADTAREGKRRDFPLRKDWDEVKEEVMLTGLRAKFSDVVLRRRLLETGNRNLIENSPTDSYWGVGRDGTGKNRLGILLMQVRAELV